MLDSLKGTLLVGAFLAQAGAVAWGAHELTASHYRSKAAEVQTQHAQALARAAKEANDETERRINAQRAVTEAAQARADQAQAALERADRAAAGLRRVLQDLSSRASTLDPSTALDCATARATTRVLSDLLGRSDERAGVLAKYADASRNAGLACEQTYHSLTKDRP